MVSEPYKSKAYSRSVALNIANGCDEYATRWHAHRGFMRRMKNEWNAHMLDAPIGVTFWGWVKGRARLVQYGKTSHVNWHGWCLADQGPENFDLCDPTHWMRRTKDAPMPNGPVS